VPVEPEKPEGRITFVAMKGVQQELINAPLMSAHRVADMPERPWRENSSAFDLLNRLSKIVLPKRIRMHVKRFVGRENKLT
jgi:hypothetical protein